MACEYQVMSNSRLLAAEEVSPLPLKVTSVQHMLFDTAMQLASAMLRAKLALFRPQLIPTPTAGLSAKVTAPNVGAFKRKLAVSGVLVGAIVRAQLCARL